jgi:hypothetical protein
MSKIMLLVVLISLTGCLHARHSGLVIPGTMRQAQRPEFYPAVCRPSRRKVRVQRSGDHGELLGAASGTSGLVKVKVVILSGAVASLREAATQSKDPYVLHALAVESRGPNSFALQARL